MIEIIPALLVHDKQTFELRLNQVLSVTNYVQVDVTDGTFVKNHTWFDTVNLIEEDFEIKYWLHLMIDDPILYITNFPSVEIRHIEGITAHLNVLQNDKLDIFVDLVKSLGVKVGVASDTTFAGLDLEKYSLDEALVLGVRPGFSGEPMLNDTFDRVKSAGNKAEVVAVDGGVNEDNIDALIKSGASRFYLSSFIFDDKDPKSVIENFKNKYNV